MKTLAAFVVFLFFGFTFSADLGEELTIRLRNFTRSGRDLASKESADLVFETVKCFNQTDTGFSTENAQQLTSLLFNYLTGLLAIYRADFDPFRQLSEAAVFNIGTLEELTKTVKEINFNMLMTLTTIYSSITNVALWHDTNPNQGRIDSLANSTLMSELTH